MAVRRHMAKMAKHEKVSIDAPVKDSLGSTRVPLAKDTPSKRYDEEAPGETRAIDPSERSDKVRQRQLENDDV